MLPSSSLNSLPFDAGQVVKIGFIRWEQLPYASRNEADDSGMNQNGKNCRPLYQNNELKDAW